MDIAVDTSGLYGNAGGVSVCAEGDAAEVRFSPDPHGGPECLWFCFRVRVEDASGGATVRLVLEHFYNALASAPYDTVRPVVRADDGDWARLGPPEVVGLRDGRSELVWTVDAPKRHVDVALCYPYGREDVDRLVAESDGYWRADTIGLSQGGRPIVRLCNDAGSPGGDRPGLYLAARQHSGETPGSWVLDGFLRHLAGRDDAPLTWAVPLTNIDGVEQGDYGKDNFPFDLNRAWGQPPMRHEVLVFQRDIARWTGRCRPTFALDFHAPGGTESDGAYVFLPSPEKFPVQSWRMKRLADAMADALTSRYAAPEFAKVARYASRWETPTFTSFFCGPVGINALSLETPYGVIGEAALTREDYREIGVRLAGVVCNQIARSEL